MTQEEITTAKHELEQKMNESKLTLQDTVDQVHESYLAPLESFSHIGHNIKSMLEGVDVAGIVKKVALVAFAIYGLKHKGIIWQIISSVAVSIIVKKLTEKIIEFTEQQFLEA
jgi:hypothetical protein